MITREQVRAALMLHLWEFDYVPTNADVSDDTPLSTLDLNSLDKIDLIIDLEEELNVVTKDEDHWKEPTETIGQFVDAFLANSSRL